MSADVRIGTNHGECGAHYEEHPTRPNLVAVCTRPDGHDGEHSNVLARPTSEAAR